MSFTIVKVTTDKSRQPDETLILKVTTDSNNDTQKQNFDLKLENNVVKCKIQNEPGSQEIQNKGKEEKDTEACLNKNSDPGGAQSVEQNPSFTTVPLQALPRKETLENFEGKLCEDQRPSTKRQLSAESAAKSVSVRKRSTVKKCQEETVKPLIIPSTQTARHYLPAVSERKPRKLLFSTTEIFNKIDTFAIAKGKELRELEVFNAQSIARAVTEGARNDLEKLRAVWIWLCHNIEYDLEGYLGLSQKIFSPDEVIRTGKGVCSGYSYLCVEMCREVGIDCVEVSGYSKGMGYQTGHSLAEKRSDHEWNAVFMGGQWCLLDSCWGAGTVNMKTQTFLKRYDDFYFLTEPSEFINSHFPDDQTWQQLSTPISMEEFEARPLKTSAFYQFGLTLSDPTQYKTTTDDGEAIVSMSFSNPLTFTYAMRQRDTLTGTPKQEDVESSCGLLSVTRQGMKLRLLPPEPGVYEVQLFARREGVPGTLRWVCSLELECPSIHQRQTLPDNPYVNWGLAAGAIGLGVKGCSVKGGEDLEVGEGGECKVILETSRPLMVVCELTHHELDSATAKRCLALQIASDQLVCNVICPYKGFYRLSVFVRDYGDASGTFQNVGNYLLHYRGQGLNPKVLYPDELGLWCGPGTRTQEAGLSNFSHTGAIVNAPQGRCNITFHRASPEFQIHAAFCGEHHKEARFPLSRYVLLTFTDTKVTVSVCTPGAGIYRLGLYGRKASQRDYMLLCDYIIKSVCERQGEPFPCVYLAWGKGCVLLEPRAGVLAPQSLVSFRVRVPGAHQVCVIGEKRTDLKMNKSRVWEGEALTGNITQLKLAAVTKDTNDMDVLMTLDVLNLENEM
ncbi:Kyphoscoliosis peptidase [Triplophysa tibetana]|uniref:Kyphoscoliosis peptidase n=1 Tax=Triplophysa tibetana TaxID=1572043 RepID=A0A5A9P812_9TELE|nr:Kyphoscoliosis peptidase [Triplophysa tibetana]